jgi:hypothetical protein
MRGHPNNNTLFMVFVKEATESLLIAGGDRDDNQSIHLQGKDGDLEQHHRSS